MARVLVTNVDVTVSMSKLERAEALHGDITVPRSAVTAVRVVPDGLAELHGFRAPGTGIPGVLMVGTLRDHGRKTFAVCRARRPAIVMDLAGTEFDQLIITVDEPEKVAAALSS